MLPWCHGACLPSMPLVPLVPLGLWLEESSEFIDHDYWNAAPHKSWKAASHSQRASQEEMRNLFAPSFEAATRQLRNDRWRHPIAPNKATENAQEDHSLPLSKNFRICRRYLISRAVSVCVCKSKGLQLWHNLISSLTPGRAVMSTSVSITFHFALQLMNTADSFTSNSSTSSSSNSNSNAS
ncbi:GL23329 [Drosophila persimilis]|uniref:GL23329 n=1 Tax=Drosophila persimilis TaxID=7234 RepID=B4HBM2_DROPE|nr:GL23329 [Drosophila persimilis]